MSEELPVADAAPPQSVVEATPVKPLYSPVSEGEAEEAAPEGEPDAPDAKALAKQLAKQQKRIDTLFGQRQEARERARQLEQQLQLRAQSIGATNGTDAEDSGRLSLTQAELQEMIAREAKRLAPVVKDETDLEQRRSTAARALREELGAEKFQALTDDLSDHLSAEAQLLVLETESPRALIEYLTDPDHEAEAKSLSRMSPYQQGMKLGQLAEKLARKRPQRSEAPAPIEPVKPSGSAGPKPLALLSDAEFAKRRREQIAARGKFG